MPAASRVIDSPVGPLLLVARGGALAELLMTPFAVPEDDAAQAGDAAVLDAAERQLGDYFDGRLTAFDVPLSLEGTDFQRLVWDELVKIPFGERISYGELARRVGRPGSARAVGLANGRNPVSIIVPCHRVVGSDGTLTGYGGGLDRKAWLLDHEARQGPGQLALGLEASVPG
ncbi:MAG TPA: methylated-DNA--[protein]-cysteine S-methyltransferase [Gaiellales bacterium]|nr:methylated-DNA--[protein]-cysteine S-methyltransferase [Gaiellales bacterium]